MVYVFLSLNGTSLMVFSEIVGMIVGSFVPIYFELTLSLMVSELMTLHIPGLQLLLMDVVVNKACSGGVVSFDRC